MKILRRYGCWGGNPDGVLEDLTRCVVHVSRHREIGGQCTKKRGHGPDGEYCKMHATKLAEGDRLYVPDVPKEEPWPRYFKKFKQVAETAGFEVTEMKDCSPYAIRPAVWNLLMPDVIRLARKTVGGEYSAGDIPIEAWEHDSKDSISGKAFVVYPSNPPQPKVR